MAEPTASRVTIGSVQVLPLPSGIKVRARRPSIISLIASGGFPGELVAFASTMIMDGKEPDALLAEPDGLRRMAALIEAYVPYVLVSPKVSVVTALNEDVEGVLQGTLAMIDLDDIDKRFLFFWGQGLLGEPEGGAVAATSLKPFPDGAARADDRPTREPVRAETVVAAGDRPEGADGA